ncbi:MAG: M20/M25/M40 family metallo-hydrolase [Proteobacteria bacterium]|nr:M20/M25/M40 family metallo-hydrolase [Pseudomonadota bacterium]MBU0967400.1 M20/M25/M40 family metallo-hydrolase [Pseudomonadota bacterium]
MLLNSDRLTYYFTTLCEIDSPSRGESKLSCYLQDLFHDLGADIVFEDNSSLVTGSDCGNFVARFSGSRNDVDPVFFNCHLDVIKPCLGVKVRKINDIFYSSGDTVLGADDKAGIAILIEVIIAIVLANIPFVPVEFVFTTCEEIGLLGAKAFDPSLLVAKYGYSLDSTGIDNVIVGAPASYGISAEIHGLASHAGLRPQHGINAIQLAAHAVSRLPLGQIDSETTANIGLIAGGTATNIIPDYVRVAGEVRSHNLSKLFSTIDLFKNTFQDVVSSWRDPHNLITSRPSLVFAFPEQYPLMKLEAASLPVVRAQQAASCLSRSVRFIQAGGGSDANFFNACGLPTAILGIGMENVHSVSENIKLADMLRTAELVYSLLTC